MKGASYTRCRISLCCNRKKKNHHWEYLGITVDFIRTCKIYSRQLSPTQLLLHQAYKLQYQLKLSGFVGVWGELVLFGYSLFFLNRI